MTNCSDELLGKLTHSKDITLTVQIKPCMIVIQIIKKFNFTLVNMTIYSSLCFLFNSHYLISI